MKRESPPHPGKGSSRIVALALVRNESIFVERAVANILDFADRVIACDNNSTDGTLEILESLAKGRDKVEVHSIDHPRESHAFIRPYAGTPTWVLGVDGDEIYDPGGLAGLRADILAGTFDSYFRIIGNVLNCSALDDEKATARGYLSPPCRSMTKLYNFGAIDEWNGNCPQRLHGGEIVFKPGFTSKAVTRLHEKFSWEASPFRCLHMVFVRRSHTQSGEDIARPNVTESSRYGLRVMLESAVNRVLGRSEQSRWKWEKYRRGECVEKDVSAFFTP